MNSHPGISENRTARLSDPANRVKILLIDDEPERHKGLREALRGKAQIVLRHPSEVEESDLHGMDLVSVDEYLGSEWAATVQLVGLQSGIALRNEDGLSVAAAFRSQARMSGNSFAVSLHTGDLDRLAAGLPDQTKEPLTAAQHDLDWVFRFGTDGFGPRLVQLAHAVRSATAAAGSIQSDFGTSWLCLPDTAWAVTARDQIEDCRPPAHGLADNTKGRSYLRWLAQRILPYPTFLLDRFHCANLLGITSASFESLERHEMAIDGQTSYAGPLQAFAGNRWWRAAWQQILLDAGADPWDSSADKAAALSDRTGSTLVALEQDQPVVVYDSDGKLVTIDGDPRSAVRLQADGWPTYADDAWATVESIRTDPSLLRLVSNFDRSRISGLSNA